MNTLWFIFLKTFTFALIRINYRRFVLQGNGQTNLPVRVSFNPSPINASMRGIKLSSFEYNPAVARTTLGESWFPQETGGASHAAHQRGECRGTHSTNQRWRPRRKKRPEIFKEEEESEGHGLGGAFFYMNV